MTIASRHAGIVVGLLLLTPVFVADLDRQRDRAEQKGVELVLEAPISPRTKLALAASITGDLRREPGRLPNIRRSFDQVGAPAGERAELSALETRLEDQLDRAATSSFSRSFLFASLLALAGLIPVALSREVGL